VIRQRTRDAQEALSPVLVEANDLNFCAWSASPSPPPTTGPSARRCPRARHCGRFHRQDGQCLIHIEAAVLDRLRAMRRPGGSYSDVIVHQVELEAQEQAFTLLPQHGMSPQDLISIGALPSSSLLNRLIEGIGRRCARSRKATAAGQRTLLAPLGSGRPKPLAWRYRMLAWAQRS